MISECVGLVEGIQQGDFKTIDKSGLLILCALPSAVISVPIKSLYCQQLLISALIKAAAIITMYDVQHVDTGEIYIDGQQYQSTESQAQKDDLIKSIPADNENDNEMERQEEKAMGETF